MEKTPMQELIDELQDSCPKFYESNYNYLHNLLEKEKQVIEDAWESGNENITYDETYGYDRTENFNDYYNQKFKQ